MVRRAHREPLSDSEQLSQPFSRCVGLVDRSHWGLHVALIALLLLGITCAPFAPHPAMAQPGLNLTIDGVRVQGNLRSDKEAIENRITSRVGAPVQATAIQRDIKAIFSLGFYQDVTVELLEESGQLILLYQVKERPLVREIRYEGNDELSEDDIKEVVDLRTFGILDLPKINENATKIRELYVEKGFFLAEVSWDIAEAPDNQVDIIFRLVEKQAVKVARLAIIGNQKLSDGYIKERLETREEGILSFISSSGSYNSEAFERDRQRLLQIYYDQGYMQARAGEARIEISPDRRRLYLSLQVEEGERFKSGTLGVSGDLLREREVLEALIKLEEGEWFSSTQVRASMDAIGLLYRDEGYAFVDVIPQTRFDEESQKIDVDFLIRKGPQVSIGRIEIQGNSSTRDKVIRREMRIAEGAQYSRTLIDRSKRLITRLGFFETVEIESRPSRDPAKLDLIVKVQEKPTGTFQVGAGFSSIESFVGQAQIAQNNLFGHGQSLSFQATFSRLRSMANLRYSDNYFLDSRFQFAANVYRFDTNYFSFIRKSLGSNLTLGYPITDDWNVAMTYTLEEVSATEGGFGITTLQPQPGIVSLFGQGLTSSLRLTLSRDTRNNRLFPSAGSFSSGSVEEATPLLGSELTFRRYRLRHRYYYSLGNNMVLKLNGEWGLITTDQLSGVPVFERFFVGGPLSIRGFFRNSLGPAIGVPVSTFPSAGTRPFNIGGTEQIFVNVEYEFPIFQEIGLRGVGFVDGGNAFSFHASYADKLESFRFAWGFGLRWFSPIGPLRFEWGFPFEPMINEQNSVFEFSVGNFF